MYSVCILIYVSKYLSIYIAIHIQTVIWAGRRWCLTAIRGAPEDGSGVNLQMHTEAVIARACRCTWTP
jgi:hypothetical protein